MCSSSAQGDAVCSCWELSQVYATALHPLLDNLESLQKALSLLLRGDSTGGGASRPQSWQILAMTDW